MHFSNNSLISLGDQVLSFENEHKFLGIVLDSKLKFDSHIRSVCRKVSKSIGILYKLKEYMSDRMLMNLYYSMIYPYLIYGNLIWGGTYSTHLNPLLLLQKRAVRIISKSSYLSHTDPIFSKLEILKLCDVHKYLVSQYVFKRKNSFLSNITPFRSTRQQHNLVSCFQRLTVCQHSLSYSGPKIWNTLPPEIKNCDKFGLFKRNLKKFLLSSYESD